MIQTTIQTKYGKVNIDFFGKQFSSNIVQSDWNQWIKDSISNHYSIERNTIFSANQVHGDTILNTKYIKDSFQSIHSNHPILSINSQNLGLSTQANEYLNGDAIYSTNTNESLVVRTADCVPIAVWSYDFPFVCMVHSGWKGTYLGILNKVYNLILEESSKLEMAFPKIGFAIGPRIFGIDYEVEIDVASHFLNTNGILDSYQIKGSNIKKYKLDLGVVIKDQIKILNPSAVVFDFSVNTFQSNDWFSHRNGEVGRNLNIISITP
jgi:copper oxidase (laccase) domain-containing protein